MKPLISIDQLTVGLFIHLDMHWMDHPFGFGRFKIKSGEQIRTLRALGLSEVRYDPDKSDTIPLPVPSRLPAPASAGPPAPAAASEDPAVRDKRERQERLRKHREAVVRVERNYRAAAGVTRNLHGALSQSPASTLEKTARFVEKIAGDFLADNEITIHAIGAGQGVTESYAHPLNVAILSLMVARELELTAEQSQALGLGALYHDIGLQEVSSRVVRNPDPLTGAERAVREMHCEYGRRMGQSYGMPEAVLDIIEHHHELADGSGYPHKLAGEAISQAARVVALLNHYDNLCNPVNPARALTPHESLAHMFAQQRGKFDARILQIVIRCLGVYPPGTMVTLSNDSVCLVTSVNTARPLRPTVVVYDPQTVRESPIIIDLGDEPDVNISRALRPAHVERKILEYLYASSRVSYYFDTGPP